MTGQEDLDRLELESLREDVFRLETQRDTYLKELMELKATIPPHGLKGCIDCERKAWKAESDLWQVGSLRGALLHAQDQLAVARGYVKVLLNVYNYPSRWTGPEERKVFDSASEWLCQCLI